MKERPILFNGAMVRAILDKSKTQTRRVVKPQPYIDDMGNFFWGGSNFGQDFKGPHIQAIASPLPSSRTGRVLCPYGKPGEKLWVRETWAVHPIFDKRAPRDIDAPATYAADDLPASIFVGKWRPSIHMPRWASRITLEVTGVRVERLQDISDEDAVAEGTPCYVCGGSMDGRSEDDCHCFHQKATADDYRKLWESINGAGSWNANPFCWVVSFARIK